jgi:tetratricopeptide (TPR) repeat protein
LHKRLNHPLQKRLQRLEQHPDALEARDDLYLERIFLKNMAGQHADALELLTKRNFHPWEGGEGKVTGQYVQCRIGLALQALKTGAYDNALDHLSAAEQYPENLGEGKLYGARENDIYFWKGVAFDKLGVPPRAKACWKIAAQGSADPAPAIFYNDQPPDKILYKGLALLRLGKTDDAHAIFNTLIDYGKSHYNDRIRMDYFAVSLPDLLIWDDDLDRRNRIHCVYMTGLGHLGMGQWDAAEKAFGEVLKEDCSHQGAYAALKLIQDPDYRRMLGTDL